MALELKMPALSPTMEMGTLAKWLVREGDHISPGDLLAEIETDKATMEFEAIDEGGIGSIVVPEGTDDVAVGTTIALILGGGEPAASGAAERADALPAPTAPGSVARPPEDRSDSTVRGAVATTDVGIHASPLARRIATHKGLPLGDVRGSGRGGRILKADLGLEPRAAPSPALDGTRAADTAARQEEGLHEAASPFHLTVRCNMDPLLNLREALNLSLTSRGVVITVTDLLIRAMALAMVEVPGTNVRLDGHAGQSSSRVDIAITITRDGGHLTAIIPDAAAISLSGIARRRSDLASRIGVGEQVPEDRGAASLSDMGIYGTDAATPVLNSSQALALAAGAGIEQPWNVGGEIGLATILALTATFDRRAIGEAVAGRFLEALRTYVEQPLTLIA